MAIMAEFICRANYGLKNGNFELDMRDGEIRYKSFVDCEGLTPTTEMVRNSIHCPAAMFDRYGDGIVDIISVTPQRKRLLPNVRNPLKKNSELFWARNLMGMMTWKL